MSNQKVAERVLSAIANSPNGIAALDVLESLRFAGNDTLKTTLSRLNKQASILRLKRGVYSVNPMQDAFACAQAMFPGYVAFSSALYLHKLIAEVPFVIYVATVQESQVKRFGQYEFRAVAIGEKAQGTMRLGEHVVSTRAKTLFDCLCLPQYSPETEKLSESCPSEKLTKAEWAEFEGYVRKFEKGWRAEKMLEFGKNARKAR